MKYKHFLLYLYRTDTYSLKNDNDHPALLNESLGSQGKNGTLFACYFMNANSVLKKEDCYENCIIQHFEVLICVKKVDKNVSGQFTLNVSLRQIAGKQSESKQRYRYRGKNIHLFFMHAMVFDILLCLLKYN